MCKNIAQGGRPVVLYGSAVPAQFAVCPERRYVAEIHTLALVCQPDTLAERLRSRPQWRASGGADFIERMLAFNAWFRNQAAEPQSELTLFDTTHATLDETCTA